MTFVQWHRRLAERGAVEPRIAVNMGGRFQLPDQGPVAAGCDGDVPDASDSRDSAGVEAGLVEGLIPGHGRDCEQLDLRVAVGEQDRHGVVVTGVAIENDLSGHCYGSENDRSRPRRRRSFTWGKATWAPSDVVAAAPATLANRMLASVASPRARPTASAPTKASPAPVASMDVT